MLESSKDSVLQKDLEFFVDKNKRFLVNNFENKNIVISGATGLVGSLVIKFLLCANRILNLNMLIIGLARNEDKVNKIFNDVIDREDLKIVYEDICQMINIEENVDYIIHGASITSSKLFATIPVDVIKTAIDGTYYMLDLAKRKNVEGFVYMSSMEMYGNPYKGHEYASEDDLGYIDNLDTRSCYSEGKRMCENLCVCYAKQYGVDVKIARLAQTFGSGVDYEDPRVFAQFAKSYLNHEDIVLKTKGESYGNYCFTLDVVMGLLTIICKGEKGEAYNISNENTNMQIKDMAKLVAEEIAEGEIKVKFDISEDIKKLGFAPDVNLKLNNEKLRNLGWEPTYDLKEMYEHLIESFKVQRGEFSE